MAIMRTASRYDGVLIGKQHIEGGVRIRKKVCWCSNRKNIKVIVTIGKNKIMGTIFKHYCVPIEKQHIKGRVTIGKKKIMRTTSNLMVF